MTVEQRKREEALEQLSADNILVTYEAKKEKMLATTRDINVSGVTVNFHGKPLLEETDLVINYGESFKTSTTIRLSEWLSFSVLITIFYSKIAL